MNDHSALVLLSGGQDSTTCLAWALARFSEVHAVAFDYGQRHAVELESAQAVASEAGVGLDIIPVHGLGGSALTDHTAEVKADGGHMDLPTTFVPGRNAVFLSIAAGLAVQRGAAHLVTGICQTDYSGYPDCRDDFRAAMEQALSLAVGAPLTIHAPLMKLTKAETVHLAASLGALGLLGKSHTCYQGARPPCRECPACVLRERGFNEAGLVDPLLV
jgi:7-cyano-7-deazaguanine synthase